MSQSRSDADDLKFVRSLTAPDVFLDGQELQVLVHLADLTKAVAHEEIVVAEDGRPGVFGKH